MPSGDGTGPIGGGLGTGRGMGRGRMAGNRPGSGSGGNCVCPNCQLSVSHTVGTPCYNMNCPKCGEKMVKG